MISKNIVNSRVNSKTHKARLIAFYLPQFYPIPENDEWWGKGFTEWTNVAKAKPLFPGHYQPQLPSELGFYDLRNPETRIAQAELAKEHGIEGFCYWHYWFAGKRLLERPFNEVLKSGEPKFPFCLGWANATWSGIWYGASDRILIEQTYPGLADYKAHFYAMLETFTDKRYITIDGKPIFVIYRPNQLPDAKLFTDYWRELVIKSGLKGILFMGVIFYPDQVADPNCFDATIYLNPEFARFRLKERISPSMSGMKGKILSKFYEKFYSKLGRLASKTKIPIIYSYPRAIKYALKIDPDVVNYPCIFANWDNTPRSGANGRVFVNAKPEFFRAHLREALQMLENRPPDHRVIFIRSWNEWAEGNYLEPDQRLGRAYLKVISDEVFPTP